MPRTGFMDGGHLAFVTEIFAADTTLPDTVFRYDMIPVDANAVIPIALEPSQEYRNFYAGYMTEGAEEMHRYTYIVYENLWPGITMWVYPDGHDQRIAFVCAPGSDPNLIKFQYVGQESANFDSEGNVQFVLGTMNDDLPAPIIYTVSNGLVTMLSAGNDALLDPLTGTGEYAGLDVMQFGIPEIQPNQNGTIVVLFATEQQPLERGANLPLCWSTYYGGNLNDGVNESARDKNDSYLVTGYTRSTTTSFPAGLGGAFVYGFGTYHATLSKFDRDEILQWTTMISAGYGTIMVSQALAVHNLKSTIYFGGLLSGMNPNLFTLAPSGPPAYMDYSASPSEPTGFICEVKDAGFLIWSTYWGEVTNNIIGMAVSNKNLIITGGTKALLPALMDPAPAPASYIPATADITVNGEAYVAAFNSNNQTHWYAYLGGSRGDVGYDVRTTASGEIYFFGQTQSDDFYTLFQSGAYNQNASGGGSTGLDSFVGCFTSAFQIKWCSYFGGDMNDGAGRNGLAISPTLNDVYIVGTVNAPQGGATGFPLQPHANGIAYYDGVLETGNNGYIAHFKGGTHALVWSTFFGSFNSFHFLQTVTVGDDGLVYVGGATASPDLPVMPSTNYTYYQDYIELNDGLDHDCFIAMFKPVDDVMNWCTYFGGKAGLIPELLNTLLTKEGALFAGGSTSKYSDVSSYFPLQDNGIFGSFYVNVFGDMGYLTTDGFLSKFCTPWSQFNEDPERAHEIIDTDAYHWLDGNDLYVIDDALQQIQILSSDGRVVLDQSVLRTVENERSRVALGTLPSGIYIAKLNTGAYFKFFKP